MYLKVISQEIRKTVKSFRHAFRKTAKTLVIKEKRLEFWSLASFDRTVPKHNLAKDGPAAANNRKSGPVPRNFATQ